MAKRRSFEEILNSEFRWPRQGDRVFVTSANPSENANIDESGQSRLVLMTDGYKTAIEAASRVDCKQLGTSTLLDLRGQPANGIACEDGRCALTGKALDHGPT